jgi:hypothetical protein
MTEAEWVTCNYPALMLEFLGDWASDRKLRLFACECCRRIWSLLLPESRHALEAAERFADGDAEAMALHGAAYAARAEYDARGDVSGGRESAMWAAQETCVRRSRGYYGGFFNANTASLCVSSALLREHCENYPTSQGNLPQVGLKPLSQRERFKAGKRMEADERAAHAQLLRCIFEPFHLPSSLPANVLAWNDTTVPRIASGIYAERAFDRLPILADALLDAGCDNEDLIQHCRRPGPHVRGCWAVDLILGKS